jgi:hypothetical protein
MTYSTALQFCFDEAKKRGSQAAGCKQVTRTLGYGVLG